MFKNYDLSKTYILACSGGPDSMALLNMLVNHNFNVVVAHVNYKTRQESDDEERLVKDYCNKHNLKCYVAIFDHNYKGNFEAEARRFRYAFFATLYKDLNAAGLFVAHHKDDVIETYLLKKRRNVVNESYLINEKTLINKMNVYRPLIYNYYKNDLIDYCNSNNISYGIDKTNYMDIHTRNVIRKQIINKDKEMLYQNALNEEQALIDTRKDVKEFIKYYPVYDIKLLKDKSDLWLKIFLYESCENSYKRKINKSVLLALKDFINSNKPNLSFCIKDDYYLVKNYEKIEFKHIKNQEFYYVLDSLTYISTPHFKLVDNGLKMHGIYVSDDEFPIVIRNYKDDDKVKLKQGSKKVTRLFIDKKVPLDERINVPVIENCRKEIIFVYNLYRKYGLKYVKNNLFMIK